MFFLCLSRIDVLLAGIYGVDPILSIR